MEAIICDLIHLYHSEKHECVRVSRSKTLLGSKSRYRSPVHTKVFPDILDLLALRELGWIVQDIGEQGTILDQKQTTICPGRRLIDAMETFGVDLRGIRTVDQGEVIVLKRELTDFWDDGEKIEYPETSETMALRETVTGINDWLSAADISLTSIWGDAPKLDITDRRLRRIFTQGRFDCGGRLFGGFWQSMKKAQRFDHILIDGSRVVELDYSSMVLRTLYGLVSVDPGDDDLYHLPGLEGHRAGIKKVLNSMIFFGKPLERYPKGTRELFPEGLKVTEVARMIEDRHNQISQFFHIGFGHQQQFIESNILIDVLKACQAEGVSVLPIHDAILVPETRSEQAKELMEAAFLSHTGINAKVTHSLR